MFAAAYSIRIYYEQACLVLLSVCREATMGGLCRALHKDRSPPEGLNQYVADFEEATFEKATDMVP